MDNVQSLPLDSSNADCDAGKFIVDDQYTIQTAARIHSVVVATFNMDAIGCAVFTLAKSKVATAS